MNKRMIFFIVAGGVTSICSCLWFCYMADLGIAARIRRRLVQHQLLLCKGELMLQGMCDHQCSGVLSLRHSVHVPAVGQGFSVTCSGGSVLNLFWNPYRHSLACLSPYLPTCIFFSRNRWSLEVSVRMQQWCRRLGGSGEPQHRCAAGAARLTDTSGNSSPRAILVLSCL